MLSNKVNYKIQLDSFKKEAILPIIKYCLQSKSLNGVEFKFLSENYSQISLDLKDSLSAKQIKWIWSIFNKVNGKENTADNVIDNFEKAFVNEIF